MEAEHLLTVTLTGASGYTPGGCIASTVGLYGTEPVIVTASSNMQLHLHRPFCKIHQVWNTIVYIHAEIVSVASFTLHIHCIYCRLLGRHLIRSMWNS